MTFGVANILPSSQFTMPTQSAASIGRAEWYRHTHRVWTFYWLADGTFVVGYSKAMPEGQPFQSTILLMTRDGAGIAEVQDPPGTLKLVTPDGRFYFDDTSTVLPNDFLMFKPSLRLR